MFRSPQKLLGALTVAGLAALPIVALAQDGPNDRDNNNARQSDSRQSDSQSDNRSSDRNEDRNRDQSSSQETRGDNDRNRSDRDRNRSEQRWNQNSERDWAENSSNRDDDQAGLGVTLYERESGREGATIRRVHPNSPAEQMGLRPGDRITKINGDDVESHRDLIKEVCNLEPGDSVRIEIQRDGDSKTVRGELESRREALVFRGQRQRDRGQFFDRRARDDRWDQGRDRVAYQDDRLSYGDQSNRRQFSYEGGSTNDSRQGRPQQGQLQQGQQLRQQLDSLERQVNQLRREIDQLRNSIGGRGTSQAQGYTRTDSSRDSQSQVYQPQGYDRESQAGYSDYGVQGQYGSRTSYDEVQSPGGQVGEERLRPSSDLDD